jgi:aspartate aminotransferase-like enzyme
MEAVARQYATHKLCLVVRNGLFSYRWTQIFDMGRIPRDHIAIKAQRRSNGPMEPFYPPPLDEILEQISSHKPDLVFAPHVETSAGLILPHDYMQRIAIAVHEYGGLFVLDCIASGCVWVDMKDVGVDILISAPQKGLLVSKDTLHIDLGWNSRPGCGVVMFSSRALSHLDATTSSSFACDLKKWYQIMKTYEDVLSHLNMCPIF